MIEIRLLPLPTWIKSLGSTELFAGHSLIGQQSLEILNQLNQIQRDQMATTEEDRRPLEHRRVSELESVFPQITGPSS